MSATSDAFLDAARSTLAFLEADYGFHLAEQQAPEKYEWTSQVYKVTYRRETRDGQDQYVMLATAPARLELDIDLGYGWPPSYPDYFTVYELHELESRSPVPGFTHGVSEAFGDRDKMAQQYDVLADILKSCGRRFFRCDHSLTVDLQRLRKQKWERQERERTTQDAETAFKAEDWAKAIQLLDSLGSDLTRLQRARLKYARKQVDGET